MTMELDHPRFPSNVRLILETGFSFVLNGVGAGILCSACSSLVIAIDPQQSAPLWAPLRSILGLVIYAYLCFFEFFFYFHLHRDFELHYDRPSESWWLQLGALRFIAFLVANNLANNYPPPWTWPLLAIFPNPWLLVSVTYTIILLSSLHSVRAEMNVVSPRWTMAKLMALLAGHFVELHILDKKLNLSESIISFPSAFDEDRPCPESNYPYAPLIRPKEIRLLKLEVISGTVCCALETVHLDEAPPFWALSYLWGSDQMDMCTIQLSSPEGPRTLRITFNCATAIQSLVPFRTRYLWIDAICINQRDALEKRHQLPLMPDIYTQATLVIGHLGGRNTLPIGDFMNRLRQNIAQGEDLVFDPFDSSNATMWEALFEILAQLYWGRAWIFQEVVLAKSLLLIYGTACLQWKDLASVAKHSIAGDSIVLTEKSDNNDDRRELASRITRAMSNFGLFTHIVDRLKTHDSSSDVPKRPKLAQVIDLAYYRQATDPRDAVYALLGLCSDAAVPALQPNYDPSISCEQVYTDVACYYLETGKCINLLLLAGLAYRQPTMRLPSSKCHISGFLPSWVPDLGLETEKRLGSWAAERERWRDCQLECHICPRRRFLSVRGCEIGTIMAVSELDMRSAEKSASGQVGRDWVMQHLSSNFAASLQMAEELVPDPYPTGMSREDAHWRTRIMDHDDRGSPAAVGTKNLVTILFDYAKNSAEGGQLKHALSDEQRDTSIKPTKGWGLIMASYTFAVTKGGYMGLVPPGSAEGDIICQFEGCGVPFVLRPQGEECDGTFALWGDAYVQGFMHGETSSLRRRWFRIS
ncbi:hypothetical protein MRS44_017368 [Fusarium solani]|uniref:uncharacterized protein n=1 Tax=Fusarium solani TaxID=169388 RepID=UPI00231CD8E5|nr:hypothetical protein MRS44_017368 [Fusarium solani]KAJ4205051.1 hypothetical protein NW759_014715 [Fusarium solani]